jgi:hypothetical protein
LAVRDAKRRVDDLSGQLGNLAFSYSDPERGFDRSKVKGLVAKLFTVKDPAAMTALEVSTEFVSVNGPFSMLSQSDSERGFDQFKVKKLVAKPFTAKDPAAMTALGELTVYVFS